MMANMTTSEIVASLMTIIENRQLNERDAFDLIMRYVGTSLNWTAYRCYQWAAALWKTLRNRDLGSITDTTAMRPTATLEVNFLDEGERWVSLAFKFVLRNLSRGIKWMSDLSCRGVAYLWKVSRIGDFLSLVVYLILQFLKWGSISLAIIVGGALLFHLGRWIVPKVPRICSKRLEELRRIRESNRRERLLEEARSRREEFQRTEDINRRARLAEESRAKQAAEESLKAAKIQRAREEQALRDKVRKEEEERRRRARADYKFWEGECDRAFKEKASMTKLPFPPLPRCTTPGCPAFTKSPASACQHNVKVFFRGSGVFSLEGLKRQRYYWHEDRFGTCRDDLKAEFKRRANELFVVLHPWYEQLKAERDANSSRVG